MFKKATAYTVLSLFVASAGFAQPSRPFNKVQVHSKKLDKTVQVEPSFYADYQNAKMKSAKKVAGEPVDMLLASYDWASNSYQGTMLATYDFDKDGSENPIGVATHNIPTRYAVFGFVDAQGAYSYPVEGLKPDQTPYRTGWNSHLILNKETGKAYVVLYDALTNATLYPYLYEIDLLGDITKATRLTDPGTALSWPRMTQTKDGSFWYPDYNFAQTEKAHWRILKSSNNGKSFDSVAVMNPNDPNFWGDPAQASNDPIIMTNGTKIAMCNTLVKKGPLTGYITGETTTAYRDSADGLYYFYSEDMGATWKGEVIGVDGGREVSNRPTYEMAFTSFDIGHYVVDPTGVFHTVRTGVNSNGMIGQDTIKVYPLYYYNDRDKKWIAISDPATEDDDFSDATLTQPGNMNGNSNPTVATTPDGKVVVVAWTLPEYSGEIGNSAINVYPGDGGSATTVVAHIDLYYAVSTDGGRTFGAPQSLVTTKNESDYWPYLANPIEVKGSDAIVHYLYYHDPIPGSSIVGSQNSASPDAVWRYNSLTLPGVVAVDDKPAVVEKFALEQNYPNPFNPTTAINYNLAGRSNVSLKVFDMLGREVATLVNGMQEAGAHSVNFNAANFTSGLYIYTLTDGVNTISKKMMLLK